MIVVAAVAFCVVWISLFVYHAQNNDNFTVYDSSGNRGSSWFIDLHQVETLLVEIGATIVAALALGFWTARRKT